MKTMHDIPDEQWWAMCDAQLSEPVALGDADLSKPFIYDRNFGVMYCPFGHHQNAMTLLLAFAHGCTSQVEIGDKLGLEVPIETADKWLETRPGAAYRSAVGAKIRAGRRGGLTMIEKRLFGEVEYQFADQF